jgi:hypothetical protein
MMATPTPQVQFTITVADFKKKFKNEKGNCTAHDLHNTLLEDFSGQH